MTTEELTLIDDKMRAEIAKMIAETAKINRENKYYPLVLGAAFFAGSASIVMVGFRLFGI